MAPPQLVSLFIYLELALCLGAVGILIYTREWRRYWALGLLLATRALGLLGSIAIRTAGRSADPHMIYRIYYWAYWTLFTVETVLAAFVLYAILRNGTGPFNRLRRMFTTGFTSLIVVLAATAVLSASILHVSRAGWIVGTALQAQRTICILALAALFLMVAAMRPLGLSWRNRVVGVALGFALLSMNNIVEWALPGAKWRHLLEILNGTTFCVGAAVWTVYLILPEATRTTQRSDSLLVRWDQRTVG